MANVSVMDARMRSSRQFAQKSTGSYRKTGRKIDDAVSKRSARAPNPNHVDGDEFVEFKYVEEVQEDGTIRVKRKRVVRRQVQDTVFLTKEEVREIEIIFNTFDADNSGNIEISELKNAMKALGMNKSKEELKEIMEKADKDGSGDIDL